MFNSHRTYIQPPSVAIKLLLLCVPKYFAEQLLGDLEEEFHLRAKGNIFKAKYWFWQQAIFSSYICLKENAGSFVFLKIVTFIISILLFIVIFQLMAWLSYADSLENFSPQFLETLVSGHIHMAIFESAFWAQTPTSWQKIDDWSFLINESSMVLCLFSSCLFIFMDRNQKFSPHQIALFGFAAMFIPYIFAIGFLNIFTFPTKMVGPVLSLMLLNIFYLLIPVTYAVLRKVILQSSEQGQKSR